VALHLPPAVSINRFVGGYKSISDFTDLADTETSDAQNTVYGPNGDIDKRAGSLKLLNAKLTSVSATAGAPITGHYWFDKLGVTATYHVVAAGDSLFQYSSATSTRIYTALTENSEAFFSFVQTQDPRSASDDILLATNGVNPIIVWNGSGTATRLNLFTSATQVPICKYLLNHKERVYAVNIVDATDVDAAVKVMRTGFGTDGAPDPHRFTESFYCGGSSRTGDLRGAKVLNDQIILYARSTIWKFSPGSGGVGDLTQMQERVGLYAPYSLVDAGNFHIFLSENGVFAYDGVNLVHLSEKVDDELLKDANLDRLRFAKAVFNKEKNQYQLYYAEGTSLRNNRCLTYDLRLKVWQPPMTGRYVSYVSNFDDADGIERTIYGDYKGYLYEDGRGLNDGIATGYNGTVSAATLTTLTDSSATFSTAGDGLGGLVLRIISGVGEGQERVIESNTSAVLTLESPWNTPPNSASTYTIGGIDAHWRSKDFDFGNHDIVKIFRHVRTRIQEVGQVYLTMHYIVDFKEVTQATSKGILLRKDGFTWDVSRWDSARWDGVGTLNQKTSLRSTPTQSLYGTHLALRFSNRKANESFSLSGFDIEFKAIGKR
jgi:hypothetical protein